MLRYHEQIGILCTLIQLMCCFKFILIFFSPWARCVWVSYSLIILTFHMLKTEGWTMPFYFLCCQNSSFASCLSLPLAHTLTCRWNKQKKGPRKSYTKPNMFSSKILRWFVIRTRWKKEKQKPKTENKIKPVSSPLNGYLYLIRRRSVFIHIFVLY